MYFGYLTFNSLPRIGFAHHFYTEQYRATYGLRRCRGFEIVYIASGTVEAELYDERMTVPTGSIFVLFRELPITIHSDAFQSHCTVQAELPGDFSLLKDAAEAGHDGILLPFITYPCAETEEIRKRLYAIVSDLGISREDNALSASLEFLEIMRLLDKAARKAHGSVSPASLISYKVKNYVTQHIGEAVTLTDIAAVLGKTPNYVNRLFREANGITINQYVSREKVQRIATLISKQKLSFKAACDNVGITDTAYGYRLFKKHTGVTPGQYVQSDIYPEND